MNIDYNGKDIKIDYYELINCNLDEENEDNDCANCTNFCLPLGCTVWQDL